MAPLIGRLFGRRQQKQRSSLSCTDRDETAALLRPYGFLACGPRVWHLTQKQVELSARITNHAEEDRHTQYHVECSLTWLADDGTHLAQTWSIERRLKHFRKDLHDPVKRQLSSSYANLFRHAHFAQRGGPRGTTSRLNRWLNRLADVVNARDVIPQVVALVLTALEAPDAPCGASCEGFVFSSPSKQAAVPTTINEVAAVPRAVSLDQPSSVSTTTSTSQGDDSDSDGWSDLGLSDVDSLEDMEAYRGSAAIIGTDAVPTCLEGMQEDRLPAVDANILATAQVSSENAAGECSAKHYLSPQLQTSSAEVEESSMCKLLQLPGVRCIDDADCKDNNPKEQTQLHCTDPESLGAEVGEDVAVDRNYPSKVRVKGCVVTGEQHAQVSQTTANSKFQAKLLARKALVDAQKLSGRGMLF